MLEVWDKQTIVAVRLCPLLLCVCVWCKNSEEDAFPSYVVCNSDVTEFFASPYLCVCERERE